MNTVVKFGISPQEKELMLAVIEGVCEYFDVSEDLLMSGENSSIVNMRYLCFYLITKNTSLKDYVIAEVFGKTRTTVCYGIRQIDWQKNIYAQTLNNLRGVVRLVNNFEKKYEWLLQ